MSNITTQICKDSIVAHLLSTPGSIQSQFTEQIDESLAHKPSNWKRIIKRKVDPYEAQVFPGSTHVREFDCVPFDDQLRAVVIDDGNRILHISVSDE